MKKYRKIKTLFVGLSLAAMSALPNTSLLAAPNPALRQVKTFRATFQPNNKAPTANLSAIAYSLVLKAKSLTTTLVVPPNLGVTQTVEISVGYISPSGARESLKQNYSSAGNIFQWSDAEGNGRPRNVTLYVTMIERFANGQFSYFAFPWQIDIEPLYDVAIGPLAFKLLSDCDRFGKSDIKLVMIRPDNGRSVASFKMGKGGSRSFRDFEWSSSEVSGGDTLALPNAFFGEDDTFYKFNTNYTPPSIGSLIPGKSKTVNMTAKAQAGGNCSAQVNYNMSYALRQYGYL